MTNRTETYEVIDERFARLVHLDEPIEQLWSGMRWAEGPLYSSVFRSVIFSDIPNDRRLRWDELTGSMGVYSEGLGYYTNGSTLDNQGRILCCNHGKRSVTRIEHDGSITTVADSCDGKRLNSPNDVVVRSDDSIWFTDPSYGIDSDYEGFQSAMEQNGCDVYRVSPDGTISRMITDMVRPNGLAFSLDEKTLYVADTGATHVKDGPKHIRAYAIDGDQVSGGEVFAECTAGFFDGFRLDKGGNIWASTEEGVHVFAPDGALIGKIFVPDVVANLVFGGPRRNRLYITANAGFYTVLLPTSGAPGR